MPLKYPIKLTSSVRDWDGSFLAFAETIDGGARVVVWKNGGWFPSAKEGADASDVIKSPEALSEDLERVGIISKKAEVLVCWCVRCYV